MKVERFEDIISWQKAKELTILVYKIFEQSRDYGFKEQILRASVSIMNNIAEGFERQTNNEFIHFMFIAKGSTGEVRSMLYLAKELEKISQDEFDTAFKLCEEISKTIIWFHQNIKTLKTL